MEIKSILCPTDFMDESREAIRYALDIAKKYDSKVYLIHVLHDLEKITGWYVPHVTVDELYKDIENGARKEMDKIGKEEFRGFDNVKSVVLKGVPYVEIIKYSEENNIDLIVIGSHGRKGLERVIFGSTAEQVVKNAKCPVLAVRIK